MMSGLFFGLAIASFGLASMEGLKHQPNQPELLAAIFYMLVAIYFKERTK